MTNLLPPPALLRPRRRITGMSAVLLPFISRGEPDWESFDRHVARTCSAGLIPAVNMDTGYISLIDDGTRLEVLRRTRAIVSGTVCRWRVRWGFAGCSIQP